MGSELDSYYWKLIVAIYKGMPDYLDSPPYNPYERYPEYDINLGISNAPNPAYEGVRSCLRLLGLDKRNYGTPDWNPLSEIIKPGHRVVIKPNFVLSDHYEGGNLFSIITHPSIIRAVVDYAFKAIKGDGEIIIADAPQMDCNFEQLLDRTKLTSIQELYWDKYRFELRILDLRDFWLERCEGMVAATLDRRHKLPGDPEGSVVVNLGRKSAFYGLKSDRFYGADYNRDETIRHHTGERQEYMVSKTILGADVLISVPKLKVHKKVGVTLNAKGLVGINTNKNYIVHYTLGTPEEGGDQFPPGFLKGKAKLRVKLQRFLYDLLLARKNPITDKAYEFIHKTAKVLIRPFFRGVDTREIGLYDGGNWYGNDSAWRMVSDLMKVALYADKNGKLMETPQRRIFSMVDGIIGGENNGPLTPDEKRCGVVIAGFNPLAVDIVGIRLMGFDWTRLKWVTDLLKNKYFNFYVDNIGDIKIMTDASEFQDIFSDNSVLLGFKPHPGWQGYVELSQE